MISEQKKLEPNRWITWHRGEFGHSMPPTVASP